MICASSSTGTTTSAALRMSPLCKAHSAAAWKSTTPPTIRVVRETPSGEEEGEENRLDTVNPERQPGANVAPLSVDQK